MTDGASILEQMVAGTMAQKQRSSAGLTPVAGERAPTLPASIPVAFPNDVPNEVVQGAVRDIRRQLDIISQALAAVEQVVGAPPPNPLLDRANDEEQKLRERAADRAALARDRAAVVSEQEAFEAHMAAKAAEAQAAAFSTPPDPVVDGAGHEVWVCPTHGKSVPAKTKRGRDSFTCPDCGAWQPI